MSRPDRIVTAIRATIETVRIKPRPRRAAEPPHERPGAYYSEYPECRGEDPDESMWSSLEEGGDSNDYL